MVLDMLIDAHIHLEEFGDDFRLYCNREDLMMIAVSGDLQSSKKTVNLSLECRNVIPAVGIHPWEVGVTEESDVKQILDIVRNSKFVRILGEIGLDKRFVPETYDKQLIIFRRFLDLANELSLGLNIHAAGAWNDVIKELDGLDIDAVIIHWFTGPLHLIDEIASRGYMITVNPSVKMQKKLVEVVKKAPLEIILTESDGPYKYRNIYLKPELIPETIKEIAKIKGLDLDLVAEAIHKNFMRYLRKARISIEL
jgi:TatD DNase family protein